MLRAMRLARKRHWRRLWRWIRTFSRRWVSTGSAAALAFGLAVPTDGASLMRKLKGGIGALAKHLEDTFVAHGGEVRLRSAVAAITVDGGMPQHGHGFPTRPRVTRDLDDGTYLLEGMKFSMTGWWHCGR